MQPSSISSTDQLPLPAKRSSKSISSQQQTLTFHEQQNNNTNNTTPPQSQHHLQVPSSRHSSSNSNSNSNSASDDEDDENNTVGIHSDPPSRSSASISVSSASVSRSQHQHHSLSALAKAQQEDELRARGKQGKLEEKLVKEKSKKGSDAPQVVIHNTDGSPQSFPVSQTSAASDLSPAVPKSSSIPSTTTVPAANQVSTAAPVKSQENYISYTINSRGAGQGQIDSATNKHFVTNFIKTSKYTWWNFLPKNLFEQFRRLANAYFLVIVVIQAIPGVSPFPIYTSLAPLIFILAVGALNEAREDWVRHKADNVANGRTCIVVGKDGQETEITSANVEVGTILRITQGQEFPADLILLTSARDDATCYVNTANLDGEAAPKVRMCPIATMEIEQPSELASLHGTIRYERPSASLYRFQGSLAMLDQQTQQTVMHPLGDKQLLLRASKLVNTEYIYGLVVYTGVETKMMLNRNPARFKFSHFEVLLNKFVIVCLILNIFICLAPSIFYGTIDVSFPRYYGIHEEGGLGGFLNFITQYILFSFMVPMSLYVTIELVKVGQSKFMEWDNEMAYYDEDTQTLNKCVVKAAALNEELGVVDVICSDKTGTLTCNRMELSRCTVAGHLFYDKVEVMKDIETSNPTSQQDKKRWGKPQLMIEMIQNAFGHVTTLKTQSTITNNNNEELNIINPLDGIDDSDMSIHTQREFLLCLLCCNAVLPQRDVETGKIKFESQSPDEIALLQAIDRCGLSLYSRSGNTVTVRLNLANSTQNYYFTFTILATLDFSSTWRRMSVVVRLSDNSIRIYTKGADTTISQLIDMNNPIQKQQTTTNIKN